MPTSDQRATQPHRRRGIGIGALAATACIGTTMLLQGRAVDPWSLLLVAPLLVTAASLGDRLRLPRRRARGLHDELDPETGVANGRAALAMLDREADRSRNYGSVLSIAVLEVAQDALRTVPPRRGTRVWGQLLRLVADDVRMGDLVCRVPTADGEMVVVMLPDTGAEGARQFTQRLLAMAQRHLLAAGLPIDGHVSAQPLTRPGDDEAIARLQRRLQVLDGADALIRDVDVRTRRRRRAEGSRRTQPVGLPQD